MRAERQVREREKKLRRLFDSALDGIIELDQQLQVTRMNPAAEKIFGCAGANVAGKNFTRFLLPDAQEKLATLIIDLDTRPEGERYLWIPGGLKALGGSGAEFLAEATLSRRTEWKSRALEPSLTGCTGARCCFRAYNHAIRPRNSAPAVLLQVA